MYIHSDHHSWLSCPGSREKRTQNKNFPLLLSLPLLLSHSPLHRQKEEQGDRFLSSFSVHKTIQSFLLDSNSFLSQLSFFPFFFFFSFRASLEAEQLLSDEQFKKECESRLCMIAFLPHILDSKTEKRKEYLDTLNQVVRASIHMPITFFWSQGMESSRHTTDASTNFRPHIDVHRLYLIYMPS